MQRKDITGKKFHRLTVIEYAGNKRTSAQWLCLCDCGKQVIVVGTKLRSGHTKSCSCSQKEITSQHFKKHGMVNSRTYGSWRAMRERCGNPNNIGYKDYGGKGIEVCDRWKNSFSNFLKDMGERPSNKHTIDREEYTKNYSPENCRWATYLEQAGNTSRNVWIEYNGEKMIMSDWARKFKINPSRISIAHKNGKAKELFNRICQLS